MLFFGGNIKTFDIEKLTESNAEVLAKNINRIQRGGSQQSFVLGQIQLGRLNHFFLRLPGTQFLQTVGDNPNAGTDPEVIAPLSQLQAMLPAGSGQQNVQITLGGQLTVKGRDLVYFSARRTSRSMCWADNYRITLPSLKHTFLSCSSVISLFIVPSSDFTNILGVPFVSMTICCCSVLRSTA